MDIVHLRIVVVFEIETIWQCFHWALNETIEALAHLFFYRNYSDGSEPFHLICSCIEGPLIPHFDYELKSNTKEKRRNEVEKLNFCDTFNARSVKWFDFEIHNRNNVKSQRERDEKRKLDHNKGQFNISCIAEHVFKSEKGTCAKGHCMCDSEFR